MGKMMMKIVVPAAMAIAKTKTRTNPRTNPRTKTKTADPAAMAIARMRMRTRTSLKMNPKTLEKVILPSCSTTNIDYPTDGSRNDKHRLSYGWIKKTKEQAPRIRHKNSKWHQSQ